jgi:2-C-methyl-D-erythritol 4-phosphate cytidylyltransferase
MKFSAIITAGGSSQRFDPRGNKNKLLEKIHAKEIIKYSVEAFLKIEEIKEIIICANISIIPDLKNIFKENKKIKIIQGGQTRQESVFKGLLKCTDCDFVLIHDGARPMITSKTIKKSILMVQEKKALTVATKTIDTIKQVDENMKIIKTIDRSSLYNTQTPQVFEYNLIKTAHEKLQGENFTDDAGMLEFLGKNVFILEGDYKNIKITTTNDLEIAKVYLSIGNTGK